MSHPPMPFVVGLGRSGTTLLRLMLDAHPEMAVPPETGFIPRVVHLEGERLRNRFFRVMTRQPAWPDYGIPDEAFRQALRKIGDFTVADGVRCFYETYAARRGKVRYGDKTPPYRAHMPLIDSLLPEARFVHLIRDGRDVAISRRGLWFEGGETIEEIARVWCGEVESARSGGRSVRHYLEVRYEDLVTAPERELRRICDFVELRFEPAMLRYHEGATARLGEIGDRLARGGTVRSTREQRLAALESSTQPPDAGLAGRWRRDMSEEDRAEFERIAGGLLRELGYEIA
jgi:Sulfotransferase family